MTSPDTKAPELKGEPQPFPFHPLAAAAVPVLSVFNANLSVFSFADLVRPLAAALFFAGAVFFLLSFALKSIQRGAAACLVIVLGFFFFAHLSKPFSGVGESAAAALAAIIIAAAASAAAWWNPKPRFFNLAALLTLLLIGINIVWKEALPPKSDGLTTSKAVSLPPGPKPDIFFIVPDGFGRLDMLKSKHGINLDWFRKELKARGFQIVEKSRSTYLMTQLSLSSTLNLNYLTELAAKMGKKEGDRRLFGPLITHSLAAKILVDSGWQHLTIGSGFEGIQLGGEVQASHAKATISLFEASILKKTPLSLLPWLDEVQAERHRGQVLGAFETLKGLAGQGSRPRFVVAHLLTPHPPFVFDEQGSPLPPKGGFAISDGDDYMSLVSGPDDYRQGYGRKVQFTAHKLLEAIDVLLNKGKGRLPVIIIQGDHGSKLGVSHQSLTKTDVEEGFSNFYAVYSPPDIPFKAPEMDSNVNTFRRLFSALGAKNLPALEPRSWYSTADHPLDFIEVSERIP